MYVLLFLSLIMTTVEKKERGSMTSSLFVVVLIVDFLELVERIVATWIVIFMLFYIVR